MAQLAELGIAVPEDFRRENAMAGDWETVSECVIYPGKAKPEVKDEEDEKPSMGIGVRKREAKGEEDEEEMRREQGRKRKRKWGTDVKALPGDDDDLDALLGAAKTVRPKAERTLGTAEASTPEVEVKRDQDDGVPVKVENPDEDIKFAEAAPPTEDNEDPDLGSIFKKRKPKSMRPR